MQSPTLSEFEYEIGTRLGRGDLVGAATAAAECRAAWPSAAAGWLLGSIAALLTGRKQDALALIEERLANDSHNVQCLLQKAECLLALGDRPGCLTAADAAALNAGSLLGALDAVGEFMFHIDEHQRALELFDRAVKAAPDNATVLAKRGDLHRVLGNFELAVLDYRHVLVLTPNAPKALKALSELRQQPSDESNVLAMEAALASTPPQSSDASILHFALAKSYEEQGAFAQSWHHLENGNLIERSRLDYQPHTDQAFFADLLQAFPEIEAAWPDTTGEQPIFIVGIPRTGSTLVERIVSGHTQIHAMGEITALSDAINAALERPLPSSERASQSGPSVIGRLDGKVIAEEYLARCRGLRGGRPRFTDKLLTNFFFCPLVLRAFPKAHIVHVTRHPLATCHAIYRTRFNGTYPFAYDLAEIAEFYIGYRRLMAHWHRVLPGRILDVAYEDVVNRLESTTRSLLEWLGLPFEAGCLDFHLNTAPVKTTSTVQVRRPLYESSLHLWQHYSAQLAPLRGRLEAAGIQID